MSQYAFKVVGLFSQHLQKDFLGPGMHEASLPLLGTLDLPIRLFGILGDFLGVKKAICVVSLPTFLLIGCLHFVNGQLPFFRG